MNYTDRVLALLKDADYPTHEQFVRPVATMIATCEDLGIPAEMCAQAIVELTAQAVYALFEDLGSQTKH